MLSPKIDIPEGYELAEEEMRVPKGGEDYVRTIMDCTDDRRLKFFILKKVVVAKTVQQPIKYLMQLKMTDEEKRMVDLYLEKLRSGN